MKDDEFEEDEKAQKAMKGDVTAAFGWHAEQTQDRTPNQSWSVYEVRVQLVRALPITQVVVTMVSALPNWVISPREGQISLSLY